MDETSINSFLIKDEEGISEYWRRNKSTVAALELARLLAALRKLTGYLGMNVGSIIWEGMKQPEETSAIILDPNLVQGKYPIPASKSDHVVGIAVREAYRRIEWSEKAEMLAWEKVGRINEAERYKFQMFLNQAERIYLDSLANRTVLGLYAEVARVQDFKRAKNNFLPPPSMEELLYYWGLICVGRDGIRAHTDFFSMNHHQKDLADLKVLYSVPLHLLTSKMRQCINACHLKRSVVDRCHYRSELYVEIWAALRDTIKPWLADLRTFMEGKGEPIGGREFSLGIPDVTLKSIEAALAENQDLTYEILKVCQEDKATVTVKTSKTILPIEEKLDRQLFYHLKACLRLHSRRRNIASRGLKSGSIDHRRLYRAPITGEIFMFKKAVHEMDNDITLLVDASSSMVGPKWKNAQRVFYALYEALKELNKETRVFAYNESFDICYLTELSCDKRLYTVVPRGKTASGEAIIATGLMLKKQMQKKRERSKKPLLIHLTDGASNWGSDVHYAIEYCMKQDIGLITLGIGCSKVSRMQLLQEYGKQVKFIDNIKTLPRQFAELVSYTTR